MNTRPRHRLCSLQSRTMLHMDVYLGWFNKHLANLYVLWVQRPQDKGSIPKEPRAGLLPGLQETVTAGDLYIRQ